MKTTRKLMLATGLIAAFAIAAPNMSAKKTKENTNKTKKETVVGQTKEEVTDSLKLIVADAENGDAKAQNIVGEWYYYGRHYKQDYEAAAKWWARAAKQDNILAIGNLGLCYQMGRGVEQDSLKAAELYSRSIEKGNKELLKQNIELAKKGNVFSSMLVANCYLKGRGVKKDQHSAIPFLRIAAEKDCTPAQVDLGYILINEKKYDEAAKWIKIGSDKGNLRCTYYYGRMLCDGRGVSQNEKEGADYLLKAAEGSYAAAMNDVANCYMNGRGLTKNTEQAVMWYKKAAGKDVKNAQWALATCYREGVGTNVNYDQALFWYGEASANGYRNAFEKLVRDTIPATPFVAYMKGMKEYYNNDFESALKQFKIVAKAKVSDGNVMEAAVLANPKYKKHNMKKGIKELEKAAKTNAQAMYILGSLYESGKGVDKDMAKAVDFMTKAAEMGYGRAQCALADMYYEGRGVEKNYETAMKYYCDAYEQGQLTANAAKRYLDCYKEVDGKECEENMAKSIMDAVSKSKIMELLKIV